MTKEGGLSRRAALQIVGAAVGVLYGSATIRGSQKQMLLALDDVELITVRYRGKTASVSPAAVVEAMSGKS